MDDIKDEVIRLLDMRLAYEEASESKVFSFSWFFSATLSY